MSSLNKPEAAEGDGETSQSSKKKDINDVYEQRAILDTLKRLESQTSDLASRLGDGDIGSSGSLVAPEEEKPAGRKETNTQRARRQSDRIKISKLTTSTVMNSRLNESMYDVMIGNIGEHQVFNEAVDLKVMDIASNQDDLMKAAKNRGKKGRAASAERILLILGLIIAVVVVLVALLQPQTLQLVLNSLGNPRNEFIVVGLVVFAGCNFIYYRYTSRKSNPVAR